MEKIILYFTRNITTVLGIVLAWRGIWYVLDEVDKIVFGESNFLSALLGIVAGVVILYLPDKNLREIEKL